MQKKINAFLLVSLWLVMSCTRLTPTWSDTVSIPSETMYYRKPLAFNTVTIAGEDPKKAQNYYLELDVTYYTQISRDSLPIDIYFEKVNNAEDFPHEFKCKIPLRINGEWQGKMEDYETDYTLTSIVIPQFALMPGKYIMKIYAADEKTEKIYGVVKVGARMFAYK